MVYEKKRAIARGGLVNCARTRLVEIIMVVVRRIKKRAGVQVGHLDVRVQHDALGGGLRHVVEVLFVLECVLELELEFVL